MVESGSRSEVASLPRPHAAAGRAPARRAHRAHGAHGLREDHAVRGDVARPRAAGGECGERGQRGGGGTGREEVYSVSESVKNMRKCTDEGECRCGESL